MTNDRISIIAAVGKNTRAIGKDSDLLWHIDGDLPRFKELTTGHPVIMGRKTWESIPATRRPLKDRTNIVISHRLEFGAPGAVVLTSLEKAIGAASISPGSEEIFIIGGGTIYAAALKETPMHMSIVDRLYLTEVDDDTEGNVFFPEYTSEFTKVIEEEYGTSSNGIKYRYVVLERPE